MSYTDKYQAGAITNSMMEAVEACPLKFRILYVKRATLANRYQKVLDALSLGVLVHEILEKFPQTMQNVSPVQAVFTTLEDWGLPLDIKALVESYCRAIDVTMAYGQSQGRTYTAPQMTTYWKQNFSTISGQIENLNKSLRRPEWLCDIGPMDYIIRAVNCVQNYKSLLPRITAGAELRGVEKTFHVPFGDSVLAGTIDRLDTCIMRQAVMITDYKTGTKQYTPNILHNMNQMHLYAYALRSQGIPVAGFRVVSVERNEIVACTFSEEAHRIYLTNRLPRLLHSVKLAMETPEELLPVLAGRSFGVGCPCVLADLKDDDPNKCPAHYQSRG